MTYLPLFCSVHMLGYNNLEIGWPKGIPGCPECLKEWVLKHSRALEKMANPPTLAINVADNAKSRDQLR